VLHGARDPHLSVHIVQVWRCFNWLKAFLVNRSFVLATFNDSKLVTHITNWAVFSVRSAVFSEECCMEKITLLFV